MRSETPQVDTQSSTSAADLDARTAHAHHPRMPSESLIYAEPFAGLQAQALGLSEAAGFTSKLIDLKPRALYQAVPPAFWPEPLGAVNLKNPPKGVAFTVGGMGAAIGAALHRRGNQVVQIQHPRMNLKKFDVVVVNTHDEITGPNVVVSRTALHRVTPERLDAERALWAPRFAHLPRPLVAVLVGGSNGRFRLEGAEGTALARSLISLMNFDKAGLMITPSRRTAAAARDALQIALAPRGAWIWDMQGENPYFGMLACADLIVATIDSISMVSEAVATSAPVLLAELPGKSRRNALFMQLLHDEGRTRPFFGRVEYWPVKPLNDTPKAAAEVRRRLGL